MANEDQAKGTAKEWTGKVQQAAGDLTDDPNLKAQGQQSEVEGKSQGALGKAKDAVASVVDTAKAKMNQGKADAESDAATR